MARTSQRLSFSWFVLDLRACGLFCSFLVFLSLFLDNSVAATSSATNGTASTPVVQHAFKHPAELRRGLTPEEALKQYLFGTYSSDALPYVDGPVQVRVGIYVQALEDINQLDGTIRLAVWLRQKWNDPRLTWGPTINVTAIAEPDGRVVAEEDIAILQSLGYSLVTRELAVPSFFSVPTDSGKMSRAVWVPDLLLYNTAEKPMKDLTYSQASVYSSGGVIWSRPGMSKALCDFKLRDFPYDVQTCEYKFGSWGYDAGALKLLPYSTSAADDDFSGSVDIDKEEVIVNSEWAIKSGRAWIVQKMYNCCPHPYETFHMQLTATRQGKVYTATFVVPAAMLCVLMLLLTPCIPWQSGERVGFLTTLMLALVVFVLMAEEHLPKGEQTTWLSEYLMVLFYLAAAILLGIILLTRYEEHLHNKKEDEKAKRQTELLEKQTTLLERQTSAAAAFPAASKPKTMAGRLWGRALGSLGGGANKTAPITAGRSAGGASPASLLLAAARASKEKDEAQEGAVVESGNSQNGTQNNGTTLLQRIKSQQGEEEESTVAVTVAGDKQDEVRNSVTVLTPS